MAEKLKGKSAKLKVKNKAPAEVQITAEQLLREAKERQLEYVPPPPKQKITDPAELADFKLRKRKEFEDNIRKNRAVITNWIKYAQFEESQQEMARARSVFERALDVDHRNITLWLKYCECEMKNRQINHARNVWDRAVTILPRANQFWYKYTYMEEMLGNVAGARQVFERWMEWQPDEQAWLSYIRFELRYKEWSQVRRVYERLVYVHPHVRNWVRYARFEEQHGFVSNGRSVYERAVTFYGDEHLDEKILLAFAKFEENQREHERARCIYKYGLQHLSKDKSQELMNAYTIHEKKYGDRAGIEDVIVSKRRYQYEEEVKKNAHNYDAWFDYVHLMESEKDIENAREVFERAISNVPLVAEKRHWRRYIYLWINYAVFEELEARDVERAREVYQACLRLIPHKRFTFAKVWLLYAQFEIRQKELGKARKILGRALGECPKDKLFRQYIALEIELREFDRCRILYEKYLEYSPENCTTWLKYADLESALGDEVRARAIYELAISQPRLDMPELLWKGYIDFETDQEEMDRVRELYRRLLERTKHVKVWISLAQFELSINNLTECRRVYEQANRVLSRVAEKEERLILLESWKEFEEEHGDETTQIEVNKQMPKKVKRRRKIERDDGLEGGWEEYYDYIFPDDETAQPHLKLLAMAKAWKKNDDDDDEEEESEDNEEESEDNDEDKVEESEDKVEESEDKVEESEDKVEEGEDKVKEGEDKNEDARNNKTLDKSKPTEYCSETIGIARDNAISEKDVAKFKNVDNLDKQDDDTDIEDSSSSSSGSSSSSSSDDSSSESNSEGKGKSHKQSRKRRLETKTSARTNNKKRK